jgi:hypothetical protein
MTDPFHDWEPDGPDDGEALDAYAAEIVAAVEAFNVPLPGEDI